LRRTVTVSLALVVGAFLVAKFAVDDKQGRGAVETSAVQPLPTPLSDSRTEPPAESANDFVAEFAESAKHVDEANDESADWSSEGEYFPDEILSPELVLSDMSWDNVGLFKHQLEAYYLASDIDDEWSPKATASLTEWIRDSVDGDYVVVDCVVDMCLMDVTVSFKELLLISNVELLQWWDSEPEGFLLISFNFPNHDGSYRYYFFRDSFDPAAL